MNIMYRLTILLVIILLGACKKKDNIVINDNCEKEIAGFYSVNRNTNNLEFISFKGERSILSEVDIKLSASFGNLVTYENEIYILYHRKLYKLNIDDGSTIFIKDFNSLISEGALYGDVLNDDLYFHHEITSISAGGLYKYNFKTEETERITKATIEDLSVLAIGFDDKENLYGYSEWRDKLFNYNKNTGKVDGYIGSNQGIKYSIELNYMNNEMWLMTQRDETTKHTVDIYTVDLTTGTTEFQFTLEDRYLGMTTILPDRVICSDK